MALFRLAPRNPAPAFFVALALLLAGIPAASAQQNGDSFEEGQDLEDFPNRTYEELGQLPEPINDDPVARRLAQEYAESGRARTVRRGSYVLYPYGEVEPVLTCAPLRSCVIELEDGEEIISVIAGDTQRWMTQITATGSGGSTPLVAVKPTSDEITTNLVISTNRRIYDITLDAPPTEEAEQNPSAAYTARLDFYYPEAYVQRQQRISQLQQRARERRARQEQARQQQRQARSRRSTPLAPGASLTDLNFNYSWDTEKDFPWEPQEVFDDGRHTYIKLPPSAQGGPIPLLFDISRAGKYEIINYTVRNGTFVTDRIFNRAALVIGVNERDSILGIPIGGKERVRSQLIIDNGEPVSTRVPPGPEEEHDQEDDDL